ncbi:MAG: hypothetical protein ACREMA_00885 [Longimicrobiales bacterium]
MAVVQGIRERVHMPIYDSIHVEPKKQLRQIPGANGSTLRFFVNVQDKSKLETNLQSASLLPHYNTFEARAMRVVISDLPPEFSEGDGDTFEFRDLAVDGPAAGQPNAVPANETATFTASVDRIMSLLEEARQDADSETTFACNDEEFEFSVDPAGADVSFWTVTLTVDEIEEVLLGDADNPPPRHAPPKVQVRPNNGAGTVIGKLVYNTVTTLFVGEKIMIQMPTFFFPAGAGPFSESATFVTHGEPSPIATFRFAEPIHIDKQQNFRVELEIPDTDQFREIQRLYGPLFIWVILDGFMTRDVQ